MAIDYATPAGRVRLLINDVDEPAPVFTDAEIAAFLSITTDRMLLAAATALETIAGNEALVLKVIDSQDLKTDGAKVADALMKRAAVLRKQHEDDEGSSGFAFDVVEYGWPYSPELAESEI